ncbi:MAG: aspartate kinase [Planctomycetaceae bacterium]|nr:aspartate kinase [Planctomycetaceae bacterium]
MSIVVQKFGGTSVANAEKICRAAKKAVDTMKQGHQVVMVVSARGKKTDELVGLAAEITDRPRPREMDMLLSTGEQESCALMAMAIHELGAEAISLTGGQIGVRTDGTHTKARIISISTQRMKDALNAGQIVIAAGFQGVDEHLNITTLGRGGSDTTAAALAAVLNADRCEIYTDVEGVFTTDPRVVSDATKVECVSYDEMLELASLGAGVMHSRSIEFAKKFGVDLCVRPSFMDGPGTRIAARPLEPAPVVTGVAFVREECRVSLVGVPDQPGVMSQVFAMLSENRIPVDMVVQNVGAEGNANVSFTVGEDDLENALNVAGQAVAQLGGEVKHADTLAKLSVVGHGMQTHTGVAGQMFAVLAEQDINISIVTTSEIKISVLIDRTRCDDAVKAVHQGFHLEQTACQTPDVGVQSPAVETLPAQRDTAKLEAAIVSRLSGMEDIVVSNVYSDATQARVTIKSLEDYPGVCASIFSAVADGGVLVDMIIQNAVLGDGANLSFTVPRSDVERTVELLKAPLQDHPRAQVSCDASIGKLSVEGIGLRSHTDVGARLFQTLADNQINVQMVNTSEIKVSVVVSAEETATAEAALKATFGVTA